MTADPVTAPSDPVPTTVPRTGKGPLVSRSGERALVRQTVVRRLLAVDEAGALSSVHARIAAETAAVSVRTVWRWLAEARESGCVEAVSRRTRFAVTDEWWARLAELGGNVAALHRELTGQAGVSSASSSVCVEAL
jgi:hypothetical protein